MRISVNMLALANTLYRLITYGLIGFFGLYLSFKTGFKNIINDELKNYKNMIIIAAVGIIMGLFFVGNQIFIKDISGILLLQYSYSVMTLLFAPLSLVCSYFLRRFGLLSAIMIHIISDLIWRVLWQWNTGW